MDNAWHGIIDLAIILLLFFGIWRFRAPQTARSGNLAAALALVCAVGVVLAGNPIREPAAVVLVLLAGGCVGWLVALRVNMIQIPAMVAFQNGAGGGASFLIALVELTRQGSELAWVGQFSGVLGIVIGAATFSGSMVASAKLASVLRQTPVILPRHGWILASVLAGIGILATLAVLADGPVVLCLALALVLLSLALGLVFALWIGGADMPVLISFLNATTGLAASFCGVVVQSRLLIACGATVGASGFLLTHAMCRAMNRNLFKLLAAADWQPAAQGSQTSQAPAAAESSAAAGPPDSSQPSPLERAVAAIGSAQRVILIPGYGMALAHAQFEVVQIAERMKALGKDVRFAIHPIAGRMPGHMHVLLAEAEVDPDILFDLPEINSEFRETDLALVVGACDVVNPAAIHVQGTPISGMPVLAAQEARQVVVCNLDESPGYSGVANPLYADPKTILVLGDAKLTCGRLLKALGSVQ
ncbi:MAG: NAD(P)(+) transhydrogenase (Re/Si-specific) subunit beta [Candidatus Anammoximicrobium sp.]|nr:NAD(P)(+) transhydrogenase (Re/Si-specific) subunit beta [Candidatus Anammoximicrobium sp.]